MAKAKKILPLERLNQTGVSVEACKKLLEWLRTCIKNGWNPAEVCYDLYRGNGRCFEINGQFFCNVDLVTLLFKAIAAVDEHHQQKGDDRCIEDDDKLYAAFGLPHADHRIGDPDAMLVNCKRFIQNRCQPGGWPSYKQLEEKVEELTRELEQANERCRSATGNSERRDSTGDQPTEKGVGVEQKNIPADSV